MSSLSTFISGGISFGLGRLRDAVLPPCCVFCHAPVATPQNCCADCARDIHVWPQHICYLCGKGLPVEIAPGPCGSCLRKAPPQAGMLSLYAYTGSVRTAILAWKLQSDDAGLQSLIGIAEARLTGIFSSQDVLLPVPMPLARMRKAGRHHAADLCAMICRVTGSRMNDRILRRTGVQQRQSSLPRSGRWKNVRKAFYVDDDHCQQLAGGKRLWVVDDIRTTGATLHYACRALKSTTYTVHAFSMARTTDKE